MALSPALFLAGAHTLLGLGRRFPAGMGGPAGVPWSATFVNAVGFWTHYNARWETSCWPLPMTADCNVLWEAAQNAHVGSRYAPEPGEIFLVWSADEGQFVHAGIVVEFLGTASRKGQRSFGRCAPSGFMCKTIEGDITPQGRRGGPGVHLVDRRLSPDHGDRFIRWVDLDGRGISAHATYEEICLARMMRAPRRGQGRGRAA